MTPVFIITIHFCLGQRKDDRVYVADEMDKNVFGKGRATAHF